MAQERRTVLVTGATGTVGSGLVQALRAKDVHVRALVRDAGKAAGLRAHGVEVALGDLDRPETLEPALDGVDSVFLLTWNGSTSVAQAHNVIEAASRVGRPHIVRQSGHGSPRSRIIRDHETVEAELANCPLPVTVVSPTWFTQNAMMAAGSVASQGAIYLPFKDGRVGMVDVRDIVDVAVEVLTGEGHVGKNYVLTGPESVSFHDVASALSRALGTQVTYVDVPPEAGLQAMVDMGLPEWVAEGYIELMEDFADNWGDHVTHDVELVTGHPARSIESFARDFAPVFQGQPAVAG